MTIKSKNKIEKQIKKKNNPELVETVIASKKNPEWLEVSSILSGPRKNRKNANLSEINEAIKKQNTKKIIIPGKVLSQGEVDKKIKIIALSFSEKARQKLEEKGCETSTILQEIKLNPSAKDARILNKK
ncbi:MAG TPA: uL15 family ribosomal protein [Candidatus Nanoarchaeia archaeon]|nr:uL15 family ribosomal protein [Candidatus Nanoarchaeia archaeon]